MELTFGELKNLADRFATALVSMGMEKGEKVAIHLPNCPQFAIAYYGTLKAGGIFTPLSPLLAPKEALHQLTDSEASTLISLDLLYPGIAPIIPDTEVRNVITTSIADCYNPVIEPLKPLGKIPVPDTTEMTTLIKKQPPEVPQVEIDVYNDLAHLAYTGGTTGLSKGVMLTHRNVLVNAIQFSNWSSGAQIEIQDGVPTPVFPPGVDPIRDRLMARDQETALVVVPWFHAMGTIVQKYKATGLGGAPQLFIPLLNLPDFNTYDLSGIKFVASGAAPLPMPILEKMLDAFSGVVCEGYGLTECTMGATANPPDRSKIRPGSVGLPVFDTQCKVVDLETGEDLPPGKEGEICIKGPQVMKGYWNNPEETSRDLKDGWLYTGDIGREDEDGYFYITDRKKDMIIYKGYNVYPRELEEVLFQHPAVEQCAVVGKPDMEVGEAPIGFVQLLKGTEATKEEIIEYTNSQVSAYKKLRDLIFVDTIPVNLAGKVLKRELREKLKLG
jgi:long-chain acyl-CoA synthetase